MKHGKGCTCAACKKEAREEKMESPSKEAREDMLAKKAGRKVGRAASRR